MKVKNLKFWAAYILIFLLISLASAFRVEIFEFIVGIFMFPVFYAHELGHFLLGLLLGLNVKMVFKYWIIPQEVEYSWSDFFFQPARKKIIVAFCGPLSGTITAFLIFRAIKRSQLNFMIFEFNKIWLRRFLLLIYLDGLLNQIMNFIPVNSNFYNDGALILLFLNQNEILNKIRARENFVGECKECEYKNVCGGCRARAYAYCNDVVASDVGCKYVKECGNCGI